MEESGCARRAATGSAAARACVRLRARAHESARQRSNSTACCPGLPTLRCTVCARSYADRLPASSLQCCGNAAFRPVDQAMIGSHADARAQPGSHAWLTSRITATRVMISMYTCQPVQHATLVCQRCAWIAAQRLPHCPGHAAVYAIRQVTLRTTLPVSRYQRDGHGRMPQMQVTCCYGHKGKCKKNAASAHHARVRSI